MRCQIINTLLGHEENRTGGIGTGARATAAGGKAHPPEAGFQASPFKKYRERDTKDGYADANKR